MQEKIITIIEKKIQDWRIEDVQARNIRPRCKVLVDLNGEFTVKDLTDFAMSVVEEINIKAPQLGL